MISDGVCDLNDLFEFFDDLFSKRTRFSSDLLLAIDWYHIRTKIAKQSQVNKEQAHFRCFSKTWTSTV